MAFQKSQGLTAVVGNESTVLTLGFIHTIPSVASAFGMWERAV